MYGSRMNVITPSLLQLFEWRCMQAKEKEVEIMHQLNEKVMSDEEQIVMIQIY